MGQVVNIACSFDESSLFNVEEVNSSFAKGNLKICYTGKNRNGSFISKEAIVAALPSLRNVPIVCHWDYEANEIGGHDIELVSDNDGGLRLRNLTEPCGVIPDHARFSFVVDTDENGNTHEYLLAEDVILWRRQDVFAHIMNDLGGKVDHSMEISVSEGFSTNGVYHINKFEFTALCLLENCEPCFEGSELELFSMSEFRAKYEEMMKEFKESFGKISTSDEEDIHPQNNEEGGMKVLEEKMSLLEKYNVKLEDLDFNIEEFTLEEIEAKLATYAEESEETDDEKKKNIFALESQIREGLYDVMGKEIISTPWGEDCRYILTDYDLDKMEVYCWDQKDWKIYGFPFEMNGDVPVVDFNCKKRMKYVLAEFDEGDATPAISEQFTKIVSGYQAASDSIKSMSSELDELRQFKLGVENATARAEREAVLTQFEDLVGVEAFEELRTNCMEYSVETLEEKCFAIRGRNAVVKFSAEQKAPKLPVEKKNVTNDEPYGGAFVKYGLYPNK